MKTKPWYEKYKQTLHLCYSFNAMKIHQKQYKPNTAFTINFSINVKNEIRQWLQIGRYQDSLYKSNVNYSWL